MWMSCPTEAQCLAQLSMGVPGSRISFIVSLVYLRVNAAPTLCGAGVLSPGWRPGRPAASHLSPNPECPNRFYMLTQFATNGTGAYRPDYRRPSPLGCASLGCTRPLRNYTLTVGYIYYADAHALPAHIQAWSSFQVQHSQKLLFTIVDDASPKHVRAGDYLRNTWVPTALCMRIFRITKDIAWNIGGARNLLMATAATSAVIIMDMDVQLSARSVPGLLSLATRLTDRRTSLQGVVIKDFMREISTKAINQTNTSKRVTPHPAIMMMPPRVYWMIGGCDESFVGHYGMTDPHVRWRATHSGPLISVESAGIQIPPFQEMHVRGSRLPRNATVNKARMRALLDGRSLWMSSYLHFSWRCDVYERRYG
mmetsp:Transcript_21025/g.51732  ORF Transcript_21025/g.51732 Transcript_21025/m.51732 type:complete len:367 (+) Transcript_21025:1-1101(+)